MIAVTTGKIMTIEELNNVKGRAWEDVDVSSCPVTSTTLGRSQLMTTTQH